jgi:hypothetical protein
MIYIIYHGGLKSIPWFDVLVNTWTSPQTVKEIQGKVDQRQPMIRRKRNYTHDQIIAID